MSDTYTKLFSSITDSTIWREPDHVRIVWVTMMAMADAQGCIYASVPGLADRARKSVDETLDALKRFQEPDQWSRSKEADGRRIIPIDGGWALINHGKYRAIRAAEERRAYMREYMREYRKQDVSNPEQSLAKLAGLAPPAPSPTPSKESSLRLDVITATPDDPPQPTPAKPNGNGHKQHVPFGEIVSLYHEVLPMLPKVEKLTETRKGYIRQRWAQDLPSLDQWRNYFDYVRQSPFLTGRSSGRDGKPPFRASLEWLTRPANYAKVAEENYHR